MNKENRKFKNGLNWFQRVAGSVLLAVALVVVSVLAPATVGKAATKDSAEYYQSVEKAYLEKEIDEFTKSFKEYVKNYKKVSSGLAAEGNIKVEVDSKLSTMLGLKDFRSFKASFGSKQTDKKLNSLITYFYNDLKIITVDYFYDLEKGIYYVMIPEFTKAYLKLPASIANSGSLAPYTTDVMNIVTSDEITEELLNRILKKYTRAAVGEIKEVKTMDYLVTAGDISDKQTMYTVEVDRQLLINMLDSILKTAKLDKDLQDLLVNLEICKAEEYDATIDMLLEYVAGLKKTAAKENKTLFEMNVWVDSEGNITGREFVFHDSDTYAVGYKALKSGDKTGIDVWFMVEDEILRLNGTISDHNGRYNGDLALSYENTYTDDIVKFNISVNDVYSTEKDGFSFINGNIVITGKSIPGYKIEIGLSGSETSQTIKTDLVQGDTKLVSVTIGTKIVPYEDFNLPSENDKIYDMETQLEDYFKEVDMDSFINDVKNKINVDGVESLLKSLFSVNKDY